MKGKGEGGSVKGEWQGKGLAESAQPIKTSSTEPAKFGLKLHMAQLSHRLAGVS